MTTFNAASRYGIAVQALSSACASAVRAQTNLGARGTEAFAAILAADHGTSAKTASARIADDIPSSRDKGHPFGVVRSRNVAFFGDSANLAALRAAIPSPEAMTPEAFQEAVVTYCKGINVRKWYDDRAAAKKAQAATEVEDKNASTREPDVLDETAAGLVVLNEGINPVMQAQTSAGKAIAALLDMAQGDMAVDALEALAAIAEQVTAAIATATAPKAEAAKAA